MTSKLIKSDQLDTAIKLAEKYHNGQIRDDGSPYVHHPLTVVSILKKYNLPEDVLVAGMLHDICEDTEITNIEIQDKFGTRVGFIIHALTKNQKPKDTSKLKAEYQKNPECVVEGSYSNFEEYIDYRFLLYINRLYMSIWAEPWTMFVKMADQIHNIQTLGAFRPEKQLRKIEEIEQYFYPMYEKCREVMSDMYLPKYKAIFSELKTEVEKAKAKLPEKCKKEPLVS